MMNARALLFLWASMASLCAQSEAEVSDEGAAVLRHLAIEGRVERYHVDQHIVMNVKQQGVQRGLETNLGLECTVRTTKVGQGGRFTVAITIDRVHGSTAAASLLRFTFDSDEDDPKDRSLFGQIRAGYHGLVGLEFEAVLEPSGEIVELPGVMKTLRASWGKARKRGNAGVVKGIRSEAGLRTLVRALFPYYGDAGSRAAHDSWQGLEKSILSIAEKRTYETKTEHRQDKVSKEFCDVVVVGGRPSARTKSDKGSLARCLRVSRKDGLLEHASGTQELSRSKKSFWSKTITHYSMRSETAVQRICPKKEKEKGKQQK